MAPARATFSLKLQALAVLNSDSFTRHRGVTQWMDVGVSFKKPGGIRISRSISVKDSS